MKNHFACLLLSVLLCLLCTAAAAEEMPTLDGSADTLKLEVTVKSYIDGDTTHFSVPEETGMDGVLKARYLGVNTPESTGQVQAYGKKAAAFTKERLSSASSIVIESDTDRWNLDSTGSRYLVWVWYRTSETEEYRNLNVELLQNGLARNNGLSHRYSDACQAALAFAQANKLNLWSGEPDPDFSYGSAVEVTVRELRLHPEQYDGVKVAFTAVITAASGNSVCAEAYDAETDRVYGIYVYYGRGLNSLGLDILKPGNEARIVGTMQYYEAGGIYEIAGLTYWATDPDHPDNLRKLSDGHLPAYPLMEAADFVQGQVTLTLDDDVLTADCVALALHASIAMDGLSVIDASANENKSSSSYGALTLQCEKDGAAVTLYTVPLRDESQALLGPDAYLGKTVSVRGIVDLYDGQYQIKVFHRDDLIILN